MDESVEERTKRIIEGEVHPINRGNFRVVGTLEQHNKKGEVTALEIRLVAGGLSLPLAERIKSFEEKKKFWTKYK